MSVDGIENVIRVLEEIENDKLPDLVFFEGSACTGGCVGGPLTAENSFSVRSKIQRMCKTLETIGKDVDAGIEMFWDEAVVYRPVMNLDSDINIAMQKLNMIEELYEQMPKLDCGACGSPSCRAFAEDVVRGYAMESDCIFKLREQVNALKKENETEE